MRSFSGNFANSSHDISPFRGAEDSNPSQTGKPYLAKKYSKDWQNLPPHASEADSLGEELTVLSPTEKVVLGSIK